MERVHILTSYIDLSVFLDHVCKTDIPDVFKNGSDTHFWVSYPDHPGIEISEIRYSGEEIYVETWVYCDKKDVSDVARHYRGLAKHFALEVIVESI
jgi:hypothetical protein